MYACIHAYIDICTQMLVYVRTCLCALCEWVGVCGCVCACVCVCVCVCIHLLICRRVMHAYHEKNEMKKHEQAGKMSMHMHARMNVCMYESLHAYIDTCTQVCVFVRICLCVCMCV